MGDGVMILGIDVGGTGIKAATVDVQKGVLVSERHRIVTPKPAIPAAVARVVCHLAGHFHWKGPIGCGVSKEHTKFLHRLKTRAKVVPAQLLNEAGIIGAALAAKEAGLTQTAGELRTRRSLSPSP